MKDSGFTLIEVLAATVLSAVLMIAVLGVTASLGRAEQVIDEAPGSASGSSPVESAPAWQRRLLAVLRRDAAQAQELRTQGDELVITGPIALSGAELTPGHRPAIVRYRIKPPGLLVRRQQDLLDPSNHNVRIDLLAVGVRQFEADLAQADTQESEDADEPTAHDRPMRLEVTIGFESHATSLKSAIELH